MTDVFVVPSPLLQTASVVYEPHQVQVVKYQDHIRAVCELETRVDRAYTQRNIAAVALVRMALLLGWPAGRALDDLTDNDLEWRHVVYLDLPNGEQVSYHMAPADVPLLDGLPEYTGKWDGKFTGTTTWAEMVPAPGWVTDMDYRPEELGDPDQELPKDRAPVPKAPFPPGVCACPGCDQPRAVGKLFCAPHRSVDGRFLDSHPMTNERLAYMMQRDGEQQ